MFYEYSFQKKCDLTYYINGVATNKFIDIKFLELYNNKDDSSYYWNTFIYNFVQYGDMDTLTDNLKDYGRRILTDVAQGVQKLPLPKMLETIINKLQPDDYRITVRNIRDDFTGKLITPNLFLFFSNMFQNKGGLLDTVSDSSKAVRRIIQPVINDKACLDLIISNSEFYSEVITNAGKDADEFKSEIAKKVNLEEKDDIYYFAKSIGAITHNIQERL